jgi:hypothetical protein
MRYTAYLDLLHYLDCYSGEHRDWAPGHRSEPLVIGFPVGLFLL